MKIIDAKALACPKPILLAKDMANDETVNEFTVLVGNDAARQNLIKFCRSVNFEVVTIKEIDDYFSIHIKRILGDNKSASPEKATPESVPAINEGKTIFFKSEHLGLGDTDLGKMLMKGFIYSLIQIDNKPKQLIFMNGSVKLCIEGSIAVDNLRALEKLGIEILVCGTCLDFFKITDKLQVGSISNMYEIAESLLAKGDVLVV